MAAGLVSARPDGEAEVRRRAIRGRVRDTGSGREARVGARYFVGAVRPLQRVKRNRAAPAT